MTATTEPEPRYPEAVAVLTGIDGNAVRIVVAVRAALREAGVGQAERDAFRREALSGNYAHVLATCERWVTVE